MNEKIICSAIWYKELPLKKKAHGNPKNIDKGIVFCGHRHFHCIHTMCAVTGLRSVTYAEDGVGEHIQGFLTNKNRFVDRKEALEIARKENQLLEPERYLTELHSEDIY